MDGIFKSTDGGASWDTVDPRLASSSVLSLAIDPVQHATVYAGLSRGLNKTLDGGKTWTAADSGLPTEYDVSPGVLAIDPATPATVYAGTTGRGVFKTVDGGAHWNAVHAGLPADPVYVVALAIDPGNPATLYTAINGDDGLLGVYKTTDSGASWTAASAGLPNPPGAARPKLTAALNIRGGSRWVAREVTPISLSSLVMDPSRPATLYAGTFMHGVFKTLDGGAHWAAANTGLASLEVQALAIDPMHPATLYATIPGGIYKTTDGGASWIAANAGLTDSYGPTPAPRLPGTGAPGPP